MEKSISSHSKFAPKEMIVYKVPSLDDCIGMLPKAIGNYILSFTSFWIEFYLKNIKEKYGNKFVIEMIDNYLCCNDKNTIGCRCSRMEFRGRSKMNQEELASALIFSIITNYREKKYIPIAFKCSLEDKINNKIKKERILKSLAVGDLLRNNEILHLVINIDEKYYYTCNVKKWIHNDEYYVSIYSNKIRRENIEKNKLIFTERLARKTIKSHKTAREIDFTKPLMEIYFQL